MNQRNIIIGSCGLVLLGTSIVGLLGWHSAKSRIDELESENSVLQRQEMKSAVLRSVSSQMEEIAYQQRNISEKEREAAVEQTKIANEMRERSETERQNALQAQQKAQESERKALDAFDLAENQRQMAEHQRIQAEFSKRTADTLSYVALSRSLGSISTTQYQTGNYEIANMLSYISYLYANRYKSDIYYPAIFQSLMLSSQSKKSWTKHNGAVTGLSFIHGNEKRFVTVSNYGEIILHELDGEKLKSLTLFNNHQFDFRSVYVTQENHILAVSRTGYLVIIKYYKQKTILPLDMIDYPDRIDYIDDESYYLISGKSSIALLDGKNFNIVRSRKLDFNIIAHGRKNYKPLLFDDKGRMHLVSNIENFKIEYVPVKGKVTAFAYSNNTHLDVYGMHDGTIYVIDKNKKVHKLVGHQSRISKIKVNGNRIYSSSYDGSINFWTVSGEKIEPITLFKTESWILYFDFDLSKESVWTCEQKGAITHAIISIPIMVEKIKKKIVRDFTPDEWNYYVGRNIPFESLTGRTTTARKEVGQ